MKPFKPLKPYTISTVPSRLERFADVLLAVVLGVALAFGLFVYFSWFPLTPWKPKMLISKKTIVFKTVGIKTVVVTKSLFYARMQKAKGARVYGPYHNDLIYIHQIKAL